MNATALLDLNQARLVFVQVRRDDAQGGYRGP